MFSLLPTLKQRFFDSNGTVLAGGLLYSYLAGTNTPSGTFSDAAGTTPNTNPIVLDANGYANVYISVGGGAYKFVLQDSLSNVLWTVDNVTVSAADVPSGWTKYLIADGQSAADMVGQTVDFSLYSSVIYDVEVIRGTSVISNGLISIQNLNGTARLVSGIFMANEDNGVTFSVSQAALIAQLRVATNAGPGAGTVKVSRRLVPA